MSETKDQTIARLEAELLIEKNAVAHLAQSTSGLLKRAETAEAELAASREMGPCGHPKSCWNEGYSLTHKRGDNLGLPKVLAHCRFCAELAATRADAYERAAAAVRRVGNKRDGTFQDATNAIDALITSTDAAARDERDRRIRLEEQERCLKFLWSLGCEINKIGISLDQRETADEFLTIIESLRAPVPAERAGEVWQCETCKSKYAEYVNGCPHCSEAGIRSKVERAGDAVKQFSACRVCGCDNKIRPGCHCVCHD